MRNIFAEKIENKFTAKNIILHAGTNDIPAEDPETVFSKLMHLVEDIKLRMPDSKLFVSAILPKISPAFNDGINHINFRLFEASQVMGFDFIQHNAFCQNSIFAENLYSRHELEKGRPTHLSFKGVAVFATNLKAALRSASNI